MSPYFVCHDCSKVTYCKPDNIVCPFCSSSDGHIISDKEYIDQRNTGAIRTIDPKTGKPFKKKS